MLMPDQKNMVPLYFGIFYEIFIKYWQESTIVVINEYICLTE